MSTKISAENLETVIGDYLTEYSQSVKEKINQAADDLSKEAIEELKSTSPKKSGKYARAWAGKKEGNKIIIYNAKGQLTHLLEHGHALWQGGRTRAFPHIKPVEQKTIKKYEEGVKKAIEESSWYTKKIKYANCIF